MTRREFITTATLLGCADEDKVKQYVRHSGKTEFSDKDYIFLYRANPNRSYSPLLLPDRCIKSFAGDRQAVSGS